MRMLFAVATPTLMMAPMRAGTLNVVWVTNSIHTMPQNPRRQRRDDDERIEPRLEVDDHEQVDEQDGEDEAEAEADEGRVHALDLPAHRDRVTGRQLGPQLARDPLDGGRHAAEIAFLHVGVDVEDRLDVRVADDGGHLASLERGQIGEELRRAGIARG